MKYLNVYRELLSRIQKGRYKKRSRLPFTDDLAAEFGVSRKTVRRAVKLLEREGLLLGIPSQGVFVKDRTGGHILTRPVRGKPRIAMLSMQYIGNIINAPYFSRVYHQIEELVHFSGGQIYLLTCRDRTPSRIFQELNFLGVDGIIAMEFYDEKWRKSLEEYSKTVVHLELINEKARRPMIFGDPVQGGRLAFRKLAALGHRKILFIDLFLPRIKQSDPMSVRREQGIRKAAEKVNFTGLRREIFIHPYNNKIGLNRMTKLLDKHRDCTGIISSVSMNMLKPILEKRPVSETRHMDVIVFDLADSPQVVHRKPVYFCKFNEHLMAEKAVKIILDKKKKHSRIQPLPMFLERNI
jgi:DNA-binding LacI/PurR family transcriptional regulator